MDEPGQLSALIGDIYDAALDATLWPAILQKSAGFIGGQAACLVSKDALSKVGGVHHYFGVDPDYIHRYHETYWRFDPLPPLLFSPTGNITTTADFVSGDQWQESRFYREWLKPQAWLDTASIVLERSTTSSAILSVIRGEDRGPVDDVMRQHMLTLAPHIKRAVSIGQAFELKTAEAATFADMTDGLNAAIFLVKSNGRIVHANAAGQALLAQSDLIYAVHGKLTARSIKVNRVLSDAIAATEKSNQTVGINGAALPLMAGGDGYVAHVLPLTSGTRRQAGHLYGADAAVVVRETTLDTRSPRETIAKHYQLTPSELRVLLGIAEVGGIPEVAEALGVGQGTVKWHLSHLFQKTGASRQADLVKLIAGFSTPLLN